MGDQSQLAQVNAALWLGDRFIPPKGTRVRVDGCDTRLIEVVGTSWPHGQPGDFPKHLYIYDHDLTKYEFVPVDRLLEVLELPSFYAPFEEWWRPTNG